MISETTFRIKMIDGKETEIRMTREDGEKMKLFVDGNPCEYKVQTSQSITTHCDICGKQEISCWAVICMDCKDDKMGRVC